jgi:PAS domain-containing protein
MERKKSYVSPRIVPYVKKDKHLGDVHSQLVEPEYVTVVDSNRRYVHVSDSFSQLLGYSASELIGKQYDEVTAPGTSDIPTVYRQFTALGHLHGLWMFIDRSGKPILDRYEAWKRPDNNIESNMEVVEASGQHRTDHLIHI